ncbi:MAG: hypothetical protein V1738_06200 [Patescibacteria group bacterium]
MSSRTKKVIGVIVAIIVLLLLALLLWLLSQRPETAPINLGNEPTSQNQPLGSLNTTGGGTTLINTTEQPSAPVNPEQPDQRANLRSLAAAFAERYGSYSNQGNFENLAELQALMTDSLAADTREFISTARAEATAGAEYVGFTTRALNMKVSGLDEAQGLATVTVNTQREQITSSGTRVYYQELILDFVQVGELWKVNAATWAEETG